ncbi:MAG: VWD domain-containing protein, partial [Providencia heimbachae]|nr:VWD domain-containing protein [Providencia heimbachae]
MPVSIVYISIVNFINFIFMLFYLIITATCTVGEKFVNTFDNRTFPAQFGKCWHALLQTVPHKHFDQQQYQRENYARQMTVLVRENGSEKELKIIVDQATKKQYVIELQSSGSSNPRVMINGKEQQVSEKEAAQVFSSRYSRRIPLISVYALPSGEMKVDVRGQELQVIFNGKQIKMIASDYLRKFIRGVCGTFTGEKVDEFTTPQNCVVREPRMFVASYALADETCQGQAKELQRRVSETICVRKETVYGNVVSERQAGRKYHQQESSSSSSSSSSDSSSASSSSSSSSSSSESSEEQKVSKQSNRRKQCQTKHQIQFVEKDGRTCFTIRALPACEKHCKPTETMQKEVEVHCPQGSAAEH